MPKKRLVLAGTVAGIASAFLIGLFLLNTIFQSSALLSKAQKNAIFAEIIKNNSNNLFGKNSGTSEALAATADASMLAAPLIYRPDNRDYNFKKSNMTYSDGPAIGQCKFFNSADQGGYYTTESYEYYGEGSYATKYIYKDSDGDLSSYTLTKSDEDASETIEYRGGSYAMKWNYNLDILRAVPTTDNVSTTEGATPTVTLEDPVSTMVPGEEVPPENNVLPEPEVDYESLILQYFGPDADVVDIVNQNGKSYYVIQYSYDVNCSQEIIPMRDAISSSSNSSDENTTKIFVQNVVDAKTFEFVKSSNYLESVSNANLLNSYTTISTTQTTTYESVKNNFEFDYDVELKVADSVTYNPVKEAENLANYLGDQEYTVVLLANSDASLQSAYSYEASQKYSTANNYLMDRNFYANNPKGEAQYKLFVDNSGFDKMPMLSVSYAFNVNTTYDSVNIDLYDSSANLDEMISSEGNSEVSDLSLTIDQTNVIAKLYTTTYETLVEVNPDSGEVTAPSSESGSSQEFIAPEKSAYISRFAIFEFGGFKYSMYLPSRTDFDLSQLRFRSIETANAVQLVQFRNEIISVYERAGSGTNGATEPADKPMPAIEN